MVGGYLLVRPGISEWPSVFVWTGHAGVDDGTGPHIHDYNSALAGQTPRERDRTHWLAGGTCVVEGAQVGRGGRLAAEDVGNDRVGDQELGGHAITKPLEFAAGIVAVGNPIKRVPRIFG